jgi:hypothetical protein
MVYYELESTWKGAGTAQFEADGSHRLQIRYSDKKFETGTQTLFQQYQSSTATSHFTEILWSKDDVTINFH